MKRRVTSELRFSSSRARQAYFFTRAFVFTEIGRAAGPDLKEARIAGSNVDTGWKKGDGRRSTIFRLRVALSIRLWGVMAPSHAS